MPAWFFYYIVKKVVNNWREKMEKKIGLNTYSCTKLPRGSWQGTVVKPGMRPEIIAMPKGLVDCRPEDVKKQIESTKH